MGRSMNIRKLRSTSWVPSTTRSKKVRNCWCRPVNNSYRPVNKLSRPLKKPSTYEPGNIDTREEAFQRGCVRHSTARRNGTFRSSQPACPDGKRAESREDQSAEG